MGLLYCHHCADNALTPIFPAPPPSWEATPIKALGLMGLGLAIYSGLEGTQKQAANFNMTFFWVIWMQLGVYASALFGNLYRHFNPFATVVELLHSVPLPTRAQTKFAALAPKPSSSTLNGVALLWFLAYAYYELFGNSHPENLSIALLLYLAYCVAGSALLGKTRFFAEADFIGVYFNFLGRLNQSIRGLFNRQDAAGLEWPAPSMPAVVFIAGLFSTIAFDGLRNTEWWWSSVYPLFCSTDTLAHTTSPQSNAWFEQFEQSLFIASPFLLGFLFVAAVRAARRLAQSSLGTAELTKLFAPCLMPLVVTYGFSHYFCLLLSQGIQIIHLLSDPLDAGWNLFGTRGMFRSPVILDAQVVWLIQLFSILCGHAVSVFLLHQRAFDIFREEKKANAGNCRYSQLIIARRLLPHRTFQSSH
ncbi:MAG: hypothetical protein HC848_02585 [Limnobacter sp.]|nr:hypothetical protein [Limnobacter sp.]